MPKLETRTATLTDAVDEAFSELESLAEEMRSWADGMPENLHGGSKYETVDSTASTLEFFQRPDVSESIANETISWAEPKMPKRGFSRATRAGNAEAILRTAIEWIEDQIADIDAQETQDDKSDARREELDELLGSLGEVADEIGSLEFPGLYG